MAKRKNSYFQFILNCKQDNNLIIFALLFFQNIQSSRWYVGLCTVRVPDLSTRVVNLLCRLQSLLLVCDELFFWNWVETKSWMIFFQKYSFFAICVQLKWWCLEVNMRFHPWDRYTREAKTWKYVFCHMLTQYTGQYSLPCGIILKKPS